MAQEQCTNIQECMEKASYSNDDSGHSIPDSPSSHINARNMQSKSSNEKLEVSVNLISESIQCSICNGKYKNRNILATHMRVKHKSTLKTRFKIHCLEVNCDFRGSRIASLISHLIGAHKKKFHCEKVTFQHEDEFWKWKEKTEDSCKSTYSAVTSAKRLVCGDKKLFLRCNRSGYVRRNNTSYVGNSSSSAHPMKINAVCTSYMNVNFSTEGGASVYFCKTHYGHMEDHILRYSRLFDYERNMIKTLILEGLKNSEIISVMKTQMPEHRHYLLKHSNIRNISARQKLLRKDERFLNNQYELEMEDSLCSTKSSDFVMNLKVDNEIEVSSIETNVLSKVCQDEQSKDLHLVEKLRNDVLSKTEQISSLTRRLISKESLSDLNSELGYILRNLEHKEHVDIEITSDTDDFTFECDQRNLVIDDKEGHSVYVMCSNKDVNELYTK